jgi:5-formyltetrahydrofolate cyclo-ligase
MTSSETPIHLTKEALRKQALATRQMLSVSTGATAANFLAERFLSALESFRLPPVATVAGYWPIGAELDPRPLMQWLQALGMTVALPVVTGAGQALIFRQWTLQPDQTPTPPTGAPPPTGAHGVPAPDASHPELRPDLVLTPLVAFDRNGWRLGMGLGYYDRTLTGLRKLSPPPLAVGIAFAGQEVQEVPHDAHDQRLDWIVTEREVLRVAPKN